MSSKNYIYKRKIDKSMIPTCNILGVSIAAIDMTWLLNFILSNIKDMSGDYICVSNVHTTVMSFENSEYCKIQNNGILAIPDGGPLSSLGRRRGYNQMRRTPGPNLMDEIFRISVENDFTHFFYGSTEDTLLKMHQKLMIRYPGIKIVGMYNPPFRAISEHEDSETIQRINVLHPTFVWVGLGAPKQEKWMSEHQGKVKGLMIGVGAGFDYFAENINRAPEWMQKSNLEWVYRLFQDPIRLFKRYLLTNSKFIMNAVIRGK